MNNILTTWSMAAFCDMAYTVLNLPDADPAEVVASLRGYIKITDFPANHERLKAVAKEVGELQQKTNPTALATLAHHNPSGLGDLEFMREFQRKNPK